MLKNIRLHLENDEQILKESDEEFARVTTALRQKNINAFQRNIPSVVPYLTDISTKHISVFRNKYGEANIVNISNGRTLYGLSPQEEIAKQVDLFCQNPSSVKLESRDSNGRETQDNVSSASSNRELQCLIVFGCGMGTHLLKLIEHFDIKHLIVYEPEIQYFQCSSLLTDWFELFSKAKEKDTNLYLQIEKDGRQLLDDIEQLQSVFNIDEIFFFRHYNNIVFNKICSQLKSEPFTELKQRGFSFDLQESLYDYCPLWTPPNASDYWQPVDTKSAKFKDNMKAFKALFPDIHKAMENYEPKAWEPLISKDGQVNLHHKRFDCYWYGESPSEESSLNLGAFKERPNKDGLILGYDGEKLAHYIHYQLVRRSEETLKITAEKAGELQGDVQSLIMFGLGSGYQLEQLFFERKIENLFICEPNLDFFYASLFAIDWKHIFKNVAEQELRIYINIGESSGQLIRDIMAQFYSIGPYMLNNTYFYQVYYNTAINQALTQLREQLQIVIAMGEYFDHAYYGIAHTQYSIENHCHFLQNSPHQHLNYYEKDVPVFVVGNGPSLDFSLPSLIENRDKSIIISCGTALKTLYKNGIVPDFHAEIEQNRSTYDLPLAIDDLDYLKKVNLLSCNGIHPDTIGLYKDTFIAFKDGESSTVSVTSVFGEKPFEILQFAFPTVSNFVVNLISTMGFHSIYLIGIDLGFIDVKHHHSKQSDYYRSDGSETIDYEGTSKINFVVPGNFRKYVSTKHEFYIAKQLMERAIQNSHGEVTFYNCCDGAQIQGSHPLPIDNLLISSSPEDKSSAVDAIKSKCFGYAFEENARDTFTDRFSHDLLLADLNKFENKIKQRISSIEDAEELLNHQRKTLLDSYRDGKSLLFYYLYGTTNYVNTVLSKLIQSATEEEQTISLMRDFQELWSDTFSSIKHILNSPKHNFDVSASFTITKRQGLLNKRHIEGKKVAFVTQSIPFIEELEACVAFIRDNHHWQFEVSIYKNEQEIDEDYDYAFYFEDDFSPQAISPDYGNSGQKKNIVIASDQELPVIKQQLKSSSSDKVFLLIYNEGNSFTNPTPKWRYDYSFIALNSIFIGIQDHPQSILVPKIIVKKDAELSHNTIENFLSAVPRSYTIDYGEYICFTDSFSEDELLLPNGNRGQLKHQKLSKRQLVFTTINDESFSLILRLSHANIKRAYGNRVLTSKLRL